MPVGLFGALICFAAGEDACAPEAYCLTKISSQFHVTRGGSGEA